MQDCIGFGSANAALDRLRVCNVGAGCSVWIDKLDQFDPVSMMAEDAGRDGTSHETLRSGDQKAALRHGDVLLSSRMILPHDKRGRIKS